MRRDPRLAFQQCYDVVVVGGGFFGAAAAREAALQGRRVLLIERDDFCSATSANSLKILHGSLRYLRRGEPFTAAHFVRDQHALWHAAPHLVEPLICLTPTQGSGLRSPAVATVGLGLNNSWASLCAPTPRLPRGRLESGAIGSASLGEAIQPRAAWNGAALWSDALVQSTERLCLSLLHAACGAGAQLVNRASLVGFEALDGDLQAVEIRDELSGAAYRVRTNAVILCTGPWLNETLAATLPCAPPPDHALALGLNLVLRKPLGNPLAIGLTGCQPGGSDRLIFAVPWRGTTLLGAFYRPYQGPVSATPSATEADIAAFLEVINSALGGRPLTTSDIAYPLCGLLPAVPGQAHLTDPPLLPHVGMRDLTEHGCRGLVAIRSMKFTVAPTAARQALRTIDAAYRRRGHRSADSLPLPGAPSLPPADWRERFIRRHANELDPALLQRLARDYGTLALDILTAARTIRSPFTPLVPDLPLTRAEAVYAITREMALTPEDLLLRRSSMADRERPDADLRQQVGEAMESLGTSLEQNSKNKAAL